MDIKIFYSFRNLISLLLASTLLLLLLSLSLSLPLLSLSIFNPSSSLRNFHSLFHRFFLFFCERFVKNTFCCCSEKRNFFYRFLLLFHLHPIKFTFEKSFSSQIICVYFNLLPHQPYLLNEVILLQVLKKLL